MHKISIYVPSTTDIDTDNQALSLRVTSKVAHRLSRFFGGATMTDGNGYYVANDGKLVTERVHIVSSLADDDSLLLHTSSVNRLANMIKRVMTQESVLVEITEAQARFI